MLCNTFPAFEMMAAAHYGAHTHTGHKLVIDITNVEYHISTIWTRLTVLKNVTVSLCSGFDAIIFFSYWSSYALFVLALVLYHNDFSSAQPHTHTHTPRLSPLMAFLCVRLSVPSISKEMKMLSSLFRFVGFIVIFFSHHFSLSLSAFIFLVILSFPLSHTLSLFDAIFLPILVLYVYIFHLILLSVYFTFLIFSFSHFVCFALSLCLSRFFLCPLLLVICCSNCSFLSHFSLILPSFPPFPKRWFVSIKC